MPEVHTLLTGLAFGESPRWHQDRLWFADWGTQEVIAVELDGKSEVIVRVPTARPETRLNFGGLVRAPFPLTGCPMGVYSSSLGAIGCSCAGSLTGGL